MKDDWDLDPDLPCCISGMEWSERDQKLYFVSDQNHKIYYADFKLAEVETGCTVVMSRLHENALQGVDPAINPEAVRLDGQTVFVSAERGDVQLESFLYKGLLESNSKETVSLSRLDLPVSFQGTYFKNSGIEALAVEAGHKLWFINERPFSNSDDYKLLLTSVDSQGRANSFAYEIEPPDAPREEGFGVSEMLYVRDNVFLMLERRFSSREKKVYARIFRAEVGSASVAKQELLKLEDLGLDKVDNFEAMCWGPKLASGHRTILLMADDNRDWNRGQQRTGFLILKFME